MPSPFHSRREWILSRKSTAAALVSGPGRACRSEQAPRPCRPTYAARRNFRQCEPVHTCSVAAPARWAYLADLGQAFSGPKECTWAPSGLLFESQPTKGCFSWLRSAGGGGCRWNRGSRELCIARRSVWRGGADRGPCIGKYDAPGGSPVNASACSIDLKGIRWRTGIRQRCEIGGVHMPTETEGVDKLVEESSYVFKATVTRLDASNEPAVRPGPGLI